MNCILQLIPIAGKYREGLGCHRRWLILDGIKAPRANFANARMDYVKIGYGKFAEGRFDNVSMRFADLDSCVFSESK